METTAPLPSRNARVEVADVLRALAVMAIVLLHSIEHFNFGSYPPTDGQAAWLRFADRAVWDGLFFLIGGKAYAVFALLFGVLISIYSTVFTATPIAYDLIRRKEKEETK